MGFMQPWINGIKEAAVKPSEAQSQNIINKHSCFPSLRIVGFVHQFARCVAAARPVKLWNCASRSVFLHHTLASNTAHAGQKQCSATHWQRLYPASVPAPASRTFMKSQHPCQKSLSSAQAVLRRMPSDALRLAAMRQGRSMIHETGVKKRQKLGERIYFFEWDVHFSQGVKFYSLINV
jgi:hypothetical protein